MRKFWMLLIVLLATLPACQQSSAPAPGSAKAPSGTADPAKANAAPSSDGAKQSAAATAATPNFVNVAPEAGLTAVLYCGGPDKNHILESLGSGAAWIDYDEDGKPDIFLVNAWQFGGEPLAVTKRGKCVLYRNLGNGKFEDVTERAGVGDDSWGCGVCVGDYDGDGHVDLYVTCFGPNRLFRNKGDGTFEQVAEKAGVADPGWSTGAAFFDADGDGKLDLYVANYIDCTLEEVLHAERTNTWRDKVKVMVGPFGMRGGRDHFYHNQGDGKFVDATEAAGMTDEAESYGLGIVAADLDADGDVDLYVANDSNPNFLYRNDGNGKFTEVGGWSGAGLSAEGRAQAGMGVDAADLDGDGLPEIIVTNFAKDYATLYHNDGKLFFTDVTIAKHLKDPTYEAVKWGCAFFDFDHDGQQDLLILNGHIYPQVDTNADLKESYRQLPTLLRGAKGMFSDVSKSAGAGMQIPLSARGLALADYDDDGDLDVLVTGIDAPPLLLRNDTKSSGHWLKLQLIGRSGAPALNARCKITVTGHSQYGELRSSSAYASQNFSELHFGLGAAEKVDELEVTWPDGKKTLEHDVPAGHKTVRQN